MRYQDVFRTGEYQGPGKVLRDNYLVRVIDTGSNPHGVRYQVHFKGTKIISTQWKDNISAAFRGKRIPEWDRELDWCVNHLGYESRTGNGVHYTGFSRGSPLAMSLGGTGYGLGENPFQAYQPSEGSTWHFSFDPIHDFFLGPGASVDWNLSSQRDMGKYGNRRPPHDTWGRNAGTNLYRENQPDGSGRWVAQGADGNWYYMNDDGSRGYQTVKPPQAPDEDRPHPPPIADEDDHKDKKQKTNPIVPHGDFSGLVHTFYNPVTSRIIGYKGIRRKRKFSALERYSPFWKEQNLLTQTSVLAGPS